MNSISTLVNKVTKLCELKYTNYIKALDINKIFKNFLLYVVYILVTGVLFNYIIFIILSIIGFIVYLRFMLNKKLIIGMGDDGILIARFSLFNKILDVYEVKYDNIRYMSYKKILVDTLNISFINTDGRLTIMKILLGTNRINKDDTRIIKDKFKEVQRVLDRGDF